MMPRKVNRRTVVACAAAGVVSSPELADLTIYVIDVAARDKIPSKGGPGMLEHHCQKWKSTPSECGLADLLSWPICVEATGLQLLFILLRRPGVFQNRSV
jgi:hypothetical protein